MLPFPFEKVPLLLPAQPCAINGMTEARPWEKKPFPYAQEDFSTFPPSQARTAPALALQDHELPSYTPPAVFSFSSQTDPWDSD